MDNLDTQVFAKLFEEAYERCFGYIMKSGLTESESKLFSSAIFESTGLVVGWKSLKNYSQYLIDDFSSREENPSVATMDTLARYVMRAPRTDEVKRKEDEGHYPYWYEYRNQFRRGRSGKLSKMQISRKVLIIGAILIFVVALSLIFWLRQFSVQRTIHFDDDFHSLSDDSLMARGWFVKSKDMARWKERDDSPGDLTLFTLRGDSWPDSGEVPNVKNLLLRKIPSGCFTVEVHLSNFIPTKNWEQAGILLLEDTNFVGKSLRLSIAYNDYSGGYSKSRQILVQAVASLGKGFSKPEEIAHDPIFTIGQDSGNIIEENLKHSALRIEKDGNRFRFLFSDGAMENSAFKEIAAKEFYMKPKYIGLFALKGFVDDTDVVPVHFTFFRFDGEPCKN